MSEGYKGKINLKSAQTVQAPITSPAPKTAKRKQGGDLRASKGGK